MAKGASVSAAMADLDQEDAAPTTANMSSKKELLSTVLKRTSEWFASFLFVLSNGFTGFVLKQSEIMSVIFYVWWTFLEEKLGGRKIEDGIL